MKIYAFLILALGLSFSAFAQESGTSPPIEYCKGHDPDLRAHPLFLLYCSYAYARSSLKVDDDAFSFEWPTPDIRPTDHVTVPSTTWTGKLKLISMSGRASPTHPDTIVLVLEKLTKQHTSACGAFTQNDMSVTDKALEGMVKGLAQSSAKDSQKTLYLALKGTPNEPLCMGGTWRKEDDLIAYSWKAATQRDLPYSVYLNADLPMAVAVELAMEKLQKTYGSDHPLKFVLVGASKRGRAVLIVNALNHCLRNKERCFSSARSAPDKGKTPLLYGVISVVYPFLNTLLQIKDMYHIFGHHYPIILDDYFANHLGLDLPPHPFSKGFKDVMQLSDPFTYLKRSALYKDSHILFIDTGHDQFFPPDSSSRFLNQMSSLQGGESFHYAFPNLGHIPSMEALKGITALLKRFLSGTAPTQPHSSLIEVDGKPFLRIENPNGAIKGITLYRSTSSNRDFRLTCGSSSYDIVTTITLAPGVTNLKLEVPKTQDGKVQWGSFTARMNMGTDDEGKDLFLYTPFYVVPKGKYPPLRAPSGDKKCGLISNS